MTEPREASTTFSGRTTWVRQLETPLREFLRTETGSAAILLTATLAALIWANVDLRSYDAVWGTELSVRLGDAAVAQDLRHWVNAGLMTFFFFVVGLEARREFDMGELRDRRRLALPVLAGIGGMLVPIAIYAVFNRGLPSVHGWGAAMSTDTAFALGMLALVASRFPARAHTYMLTVTVVDDLIALCVIAIFYSEHVSAFPLLVAIAIFAVTVVLKSRSVRGGFLYAALGIGAWTALFESGVEPVVIGLAMGLLTNASPAARTDLERASDLFRLFREQPTAELARSATAGVVNAVSRNHRLQQLYHPWTSYVIVPLFALSNAGIPLSGEFLVHAITSPITLGILIAYVVGKPVGIIGSTWLVTRLSGGRVRPPVGWAAVTGVGTIAGIGFTVSLLIATLAFSGSELEEAKFGILASALCASVITWIVSRVTAMLPRKTRARALLGTAESIVDLADPVDPDRDHLRGPEDAHVTLVEYGDFECPYCGLAEPVVREILADFGDVRYVWRHLPLRDVHPSAQLAAEAAEAAAEQGAFWEMHDLLLSHQGDLLLPDLVVYAEQIGLDAERFREDLDAHAGADRIEEDMDSADLSGVSGTPTFFINGRRHHGAYDIVTLSAAVKAARVREALRS
ncbi:Na+/H+ antiporter NhaA [Planotetraspora phitsanulokensis]|uniref:Na(+)/H(+) antiporter NhaA n=1 Tax=Planotetraspora phitsanulokensis TaxID=575192 RepID=A0A8J3UCP0_9ACTN|nr:Na+/H+ antiporter NhaA [Planotetraspora phitsanulokensis]GII40891.1 Na(+)/H(+) antiporter NhaA 2 [Planotetraspora phitsanulokensis]